MPLSGSNKLPSLGNHNDKKNKINEIKNHLKPFILDSADTTEILDQIECYLKDKKIPLSKKDKSLLLRKLENTASKPSTPRLPSLKHTSSTNSLFSEYSMDSVDSDDTEQYSPSDTYNVNLFKDNNGSFLQKDDWKTVLKELIEEKTKGYGIDTDTLMASLENTANEFYKESEGTWDYILPKLKEVLNSHYNELLIQAMDSHTSFDIPGIELLSVPGDGDCQYTSIAKVLNPTCDDQSISEIVSVLKKITKDLISTNLSKLYPDKDFTETFTQIDEGTAYAKLYGDHIAELLFSYLAEHYPDNNIYIIKEEKSGKKSLFNYFYDEEAGRVEQQSVENLQQIMEITKTRRSNDCWFYLKNDHYSPIRFTT